MDVCQTLNLILASAPSFCRDLFKSFPVSFGRKLFNITLEHVKHIFSHYRPDRMDRFMTVQTLPD
jgi:hypothetical protein